MWIGLRVLLVGIQLTVSKVGVNGVFILEKKSHK